jgi:hypothetical protein
MSALEVDDVEVRCDGEQNTSWTKSQAIEYPTRDRRATELNVSCGTKGGSWMDVE